MRVPKVNAASMLHHSNGGRSHGDVDALPHAHMMRLQLQKILYGFAQHAVRSGEPGGGGGGASTGGSQRRGFPRSTRLLGGGGMLM